MAWVGQKIQSSCGTAMESTGNGWDKVNFDEAWDEDTGTGGVGVVIKKYNDEFMVTLAMKLASVESTLLADNAGSKGSCCNGLPSSTRTCGIRR